MSEQAVVLNPEDKLIRERGKCFCSAANSQVNVLLDEISANA